MPDQSVVEELLEKGARAIYERNGDGGRDRDGWDGASSEMKGIYRNILAVGLDAVFPGWREGITRELSARHGDQRFHTGDAVNARYCAGNCCSGCVLESRLVVHGPWVPVEEGTDG